MPSYLSRLILHLLLLFSASTFGFGQGVEDKFITIDIKNKTLVEILQLLEKNYHIKFSYDSQLISKSTVFNTSSNNVSLGKFLTAILKEVDMNYRVINNNVVLYYYKWPEEEATPAVKKPEKAVFKSQGQIIVPKENIITIYDTVVYTVNDTVIQVVYDTFQIQLVDTLRVYDTVRVILAPEEVPEEDKVLIRQKPYYGIGLQAGLVLPKENEAAYEFTGINIDILENTSIYQYLPGWNFGLNVESYFKRWIVHSGILAASLRSRVTLSYIKSSQVPNTTISDSYYIISTDTNWVDIIEDEFVTQTDTIIGQQLLNQYFYVEVPLALGYDFNLNEKLSLSVLGGGKASFLIAESSELIAPLVRTGNSIPKNVFLSAMGELRVSYLLIDSYKLSAAYRYSQGINMEYHNSYLFLSISKLFY